jgi:DNA-binding transcriptional MerR regulator
MPYKEKTIEKLYWSIGEVASELGVNASLIRYWEKEFGMIRPRRTGRGDRLYTRKDIDLLKRILHLVKEKGFTLQGAKEQMRSSVTEVPVSATDVDQLRERLLWIRSRLQELTDGIPGQQ